jgi:hypothetical protein
VINHLSRTAGQEPAVAGGLHHLSAVQHD